MSIQTVIKTITMTKSQKRVIQNHPFFNSLVRKAQEKGIGFTTRIDPMYEGVLSDINNGRVTMHIQLDDLSQVIGFDLGKRGRIINATTLNY
jgi:hypothetical protein